MTDTTNTETTANEEPKQKKNTFVLSLKDRVNLTNLLPRVGNIITLQLTKDIETKIAPTTADFDKAETTTTKDRVMWKNNFETEITFTAAELNHLRTTIKDLDEKKQISMEILDSCLKILD